jgi:hypothetical protein
MADLTDLIGEEFHYQKFAEDDESLKSQWGELNQADSIRTTAERMKLVFG